MIRFLFSALFLFTTGFAIQPLVIGIAGGSGAGKTNLAKRLKETLQERAVLVAQDDYYKELFHLEVEARAKINFDHPDAIDSFLLKEHLLILKEGGAIPSPLYDFTIHNRTGFRTTPSSEVIILEGILVLAIPEIASLCDLKIFVDTEDDVRILRRAERDVRERGRTLPGVISQYLTTVKPMHDAFVTPSKNQADFIISGEKDIQKIVDLIVAYVDSTRKSR